LNTRSALHQFPVAGFTQPLSAEIMQEIRQAKKPPTPARFRSRRLAICTPE
jgi:hypothetical protein